MDARGETQDTFTYTVAIVWNIMHIHRSKTRFCVFYTVVPEATSRPLLGIVNKGGIVDLGQQCQSSRATRMHAQINKPTGVHVSAASVCAVPIPVLGVNVIPGVGWETKAAIGGRTWLHCEWAESSGAQGQHRAA
jgi:hypothetical protein